MEIMINMDFMRGGVEKGRVGVAIIIQLGEDKTIPQTIIYAITSHFHIKN